MKYIYNFRSARFFKDKDGQPWWVLHAICRVMKIPSHQHMNAYERLAPDERRFWERKTSNGAIEPLYLINESGIYSLILQSNGIKASELKRWLTHSVMPTIDKERLPIVF